MLTKAQCRYLIKLVQEDCEARCRENCTFGAIRYQIQAKAPLIEKLIQMRSQAPEEGSTEDPA